MSDHCHLNMVFGMRIGRQIFQISVLCISMKSFKFGGAFLPPLQRPSNSNISGCGCIAHDLSRALLHVTSARNPSLMANASKYKLCW